MRKALESLEPGLPAAWYHHPGHYQRELEAFWYGRWVAACREEEIAAPGDWITVRIGSQSLVVLRKDSGIKAFHNTCRHRGSVLCTAEQGRFERGRIVCPYHAWTYDLDGKLVGTPRRMETPDFDPKDFPLFDVALRTWGGFVFVNLSGPGPFNEETVGLQKRLKNYRLEDLRIGKRIVVDVKANWKLLVENFAECFHCPPVHPELCRVVTAYQDAGAWGLRKRPEDKPEYKPGAQTLTMDGTARLPALPGLTDRERQAIYMAEMAPPNLFLNIQPDYVNSHLMFPTGPESVRIVYDWLFEPRHLPLKPADLEHYVALWEATNAQDARNCEWQQQGIHALPFEHGHYVPQEFDAHRFAQWVRAGLGGGRRAVSGKAASRRAVRRARKGKR
jgi:glycine betaine catabolism A